MYEYEGTTLCTFDHGGGGVVVERNPAKGGS